MLPTENLATLEMEPFWFRVLGFFGSDNVDE